MDSELSVFEVKVGMQQGYVLSSFFFAVVLVVIAEMAWECALSELRYADE